jgi:uncharacterized membrane protein
MSERSTADTAAPRRRRLPYPLRVIRARPRLTISAVIGLTVIAALPSAWSVPTRMLLGWDGGIVLYLVLVYTMIAGTDAERVRGRALRQDEGRIAILVLTIAAAVASLGAILGELSSSHGTTRTTPELALAALTIALSWGFIHTMFALHYAHDYYGARGDEKRGLNFPGEDAPDYWDFVYFSFVIGMTSQVSDVAVTSRGIRRTVNAHGIVSFFFNVTLLALTVNLAAGVI